MKKTLCAMLIAGATFLAGVAWAEGEAPAAKPAEPAPKVVLKKGDKAPEAEKKELTAEEKAAQEKRRAEAKARHEARQKKMEQEVLLRMRRTASELLAMYDKNQNGQLDADERAQMEKDFELAKKLQRFLTFREVLNDLDADHDLQISDEESAKIAEVIRRNRSRHSGGNRPNHGNRGPQKGGQNLKNRPQRPPMPPNMMRQMTPPPEDAPKPVSQATPKRDS